MTCVMGYILPPLRGLQSFYLSIPKACAVDTLCAPPSGGLRFLWASSTLLFSLFRSQPGLQVMKRDVLGVAAGISERVEHALRSVVVERVDDDRGVAVMVWMRGEPAGDSIARALVVRLIREVVLFGQIMIEKDYVVIMLAEPCYRLARVAGDIHLSPGELLLEPGAAHGVVFND